MLKHYFKAAVRKLINQKLYTIINILSLAIGLAMIFIVVGHVSHELSFENFHINKDRIYRVEGTYSSVDSLFTSVRVMGSLGPAILSQVPEVERAAIFRVKPLIKLKAGNETFRIVDPYKNQGYAHNKRIFFVNPDYFKVFTFNLINGNPQSLNEPNRVFISQKIVDEYYPDGNPMGQTIVFNDYIECQISGILEDMPQNTQLRTDIIVSYSTLERLGDDTHAWVSLTDYELIGDDFVYLLMKQSADPVLVISKITTLLNNNMTPEQAKKYSMYLKPFKEIYFNGYSGTRGELTPCGEVSVFYETLTMAVFVLLLAIVNFVNLSTARSADRMKDVGVRKVFGAGRWHLIKQYLGESMILVFCATLLSLIIYEILKILIQDVLPRQMFADFYRNPFMIVSVIILMFVIGMMAGFYPAIYLSRFRPITILQGKVGIKSSRSILRKVMVVFQFTIAIIFVFSTITLIRQFNLMTSVNMGFDRENMMLMDFDGDDASDNCRVLKHEIMKNNKVLAVTAADSPPGRSTYTLYGYYPTEERKDEQMLVFKVFNVDYDFINTFGLEIVKGRAFSEDMTSDVHNSLIVNEATVKKLGIDEPIGYRLYGGNDKFYDIIGVVKEFHGSALNETYNELLLLRIGPEQYNTVVVKLPPENITASIAAIQNTWQKTFPGLHFEYSFLDDEVQKTFSDIGGQATMFVVIATLAIVIACMGVFGLVSFTAERKTREIGVRKVLGASVIRIVTMLSKEFIVLILIANAIAWPLGHLFISQYLEYLPFRVSVGVETFLLTGLVALFFALVTAGFQAVKAALANPIDSLHCE
ncbi:MAG: ABC transporter permease [candidate division Zixibacteria bacterium]|nr:ABC transporter permease [candidate division Zixibacteria bacterium]